MEAEIYLGVLKDLIDVVYCSGRRSTDCRTAFLRVKEPMRLYIDKFFRCNNWIKAAFDAPYQAFCIVGPIMAMGYRKRAWKLLDCFVTNPQRHVIRVEYDIFGENGKIPEEGFSDMYMLMNTELYKTNFYISEYRFGYGRYRQYLQAKHWDIIISAIEAKRLPAKYADFFLKYAKYHIPRAVIRYFDRVKPGKSTEVGKEIKKINIFGQLAA